MSELKLSAEHQHVSIFSVITLASAKARLAELKSVPLNVWPLFCMHPSALKIHISQSTADILVQAGSFELEERGEVEMKVT